MTRFLIFLFNGDSEEITKEEKDKRLQEFYAWIGKYQQSGHLKQGKPLSLEGRHMQMDNGRVVLRNTRHDEPGALEGYLFLDADDINEAVRIAGECPYLKYNGKIRLREILEQA